MLAVFRRVGIAPEGTGSLIFHLCRGAQPHMIAPSHGRTDGVRVALSRVDEYALSEPSRLAAHPYRVGYHVDILLLARAPIVLPCSER